jgi:signal transduction histidine kinase
MEQLALTFFPFPHVFRGDRQDGTVSTWPERCIRCQDRHCERSAEKGLRLCAFGVNYQRVDEDLLVAGIVVRDYPGVPTEARKRVLRQVGRNVITHEQLARTLAQADIATSGLEKELRDRMDAIVDSYQTSEAYKHEAVALLKPDMERALGQVHDYKQFVQQIVQNIDVILETRFPGLAIEQKLDKAEHEEAAIYWAAQLMDEKLDAALYLLYPERLHEMRDRGWFRFHGLVTKYRKIYQRQIEAKGLKVRTEGESWAKVEGNAKAIAIIPHTFIDNAVKYAPSRSTITLAFEERGEELKFSVESFGPPLLAGEQDRIFELFFRGAEAKRRNSEGTGFGLASAHNVAKALRLLMTVDQDPDRPGPEDTLFTIASVTLPIAPERETAATDQRPPRRRAARRKS